jgi:hypothetical protein
MSGLPNVTIELNKNGLGLVAETNDNTCGIIVPVNAVSDRLTIGTAFAVYSLDGATDKGIDAILNPIAYRHVKEFYDVAGSGRKLWIMPAAMTARLKDTVDVADGLAKKLIAQAGGEIVALGVTAIKDDETVGDGSATTVIVDGIASDVYIALQKGQQLCNYFQEKIMPFVCLIEGRHLTDSEALRDLSEDSKYRQAIVLASTQSDGSASVGLALGQIAALPVQRKISRVKNGNLPVENAFLSDGKPIAGREDLNTLHDKRYIVMRNFPNKTGFFFSGDPTATSQTDDLNCIARIRTIDKATKIAYNTYVEEIDDDVELNSDGTLHPSVAAYLKNKIEQQVNGAMAGEISSFTATVDTSANITSGAAQDIYLDILPRGYLSVIRVKLGFKAG